MSPRRVEKHRWRWSVTFEFPQWAPEVYEGRAESWGLDVGMVARRAVKTARELRPTRRQWTTVVVTVQREVGNEGRGDRADDSLQPGRG